MKTLKINELKETNGGAYPRSVENNPDFEGTPFSETWLGRGIIALFNAGRRAGCGC